MSFNTTGIDLAILYKLVPQNRVRELNKSQIGSPPII